MKKLSTVLLGLGLFVSSALYAAEANKSTTQQATHMGDHMHEGKMMNHMNMNGMICQHFIGQKIYNLTNHF